MTRWELEDLMSWILKGVLALVVVLLMPVWILPFSIYKAIRRHRRTFE